MPVTVVLLLVNVTVMYHLWLTRQGADHAISLAPDGETVSGPELVPELFVIAKETLGS